MPLNMKPRLVLPGNAWKSQGEGQIKEIFESNAENFSPSEFEMFVRLNHDRCCPVVGFFSYDFGLSQLGIISSKKKESNVPDVWFAAVDFQEYKNESAGRNYNLDWASTVTEKEYEDAFNIVKESLRDGEIYQVNLTHLLQTKFDGDPWQFFQSVYAKNPADFGAYIDSGDWQILSLSPERFVQIDSNGRIWTEPIKGTSPRGKDEKEDMRMRQELLGSEKEKAELLMITDLLRNDLGKVCEAGSVKVTKLRELMKLPHVWHTYSRIEGQLLDSQTPISAILSMLPGGSITGCPKIRACEIIERIEKKRRGIYTGTMVAFWPDGSVDSSIAIRTAVCERSSLSSLLTLGVGGGIVIDSHLHAEWKESWAKSRSFGVKKGFLS